MNITVLRAEFRPDHPWKHYRVVADVDGFRVAFRSEASRGWSCYACRVFTHARCPHVTAVREQVSR